MDALDELDRRIARQGCARLEVVPAGDAETDPPRELSLTAMAERAPQQREPLADHLGISGPGDGHGRAGGSTTMRSCGSTKRPSCNALSSSSRPMRFWSARAADRKPCGKTLMAV